MIEICFHLSKVIPYVITVKTGDKRGAGTDANVFMQIYGAEGKTEEIRLDSKSDNFERGKVGDDNLTMR